MNETMRPEDIKAHWNYIGLRVDDEVSRITAMLMEAAPFTGKPKYAKHGNHTQYGFSIRLDINLNLEFMQQVVAAFRNSGWDANISKARDISGYFNEFVLRFPEAKPKDGDQQ